MNIVDLGSGPPVLLIPGIQGRWEWMKGTVEALSRRCRVITSSLCDEPTSGARFDERLGFDNYVRHAAAILTAAGERRAIVCGVSFGGLIAAAFAGRHPDMVSGLVLVSAVPPGWKPDERAKFYLRSPRLLSPLFVLASTRLYTEIAAAHDSFTAGLLASIRHGFNALSHPFSPTLMARRAEMLMTLDLRPELEQVDVETLVITGEPSLERVMPTHRTREYNAMWPRARQATIASTGHLGSITRPQEFARLVGEFAERVGHSDHQRRKIG
jgi:pimeloyl-ACP methyl ester carboxylesterase